MAEFIPHYEAMLVAYQNNLITEEDWDEFCTICLEELMLNNKKILENLKNNP